LLMTDPSNAWFLTRSVDNKCLMIIRTMYAIGVDYGKYPRALSVLLMGLTYASIILVLCTCLSRIPAQMDLSGSSFESRLTTSATTLCSLESIIRSLSTWRFSIARLLMAY
jgi:hypothetical protein